MRSEGLSAIIGRLTKLDTELYVTIRLSAAPLRDLKNFFAIALMAIIIGIYVLMVWKYAINVPRMDDYIQFLGYHHFFPENGSFFEKLTALFSQPRWEHGPESDHRIVVARVAMLLSQALTGEMNFRVITFIGNAFFLLWFVWLWRVTPVSRNPAAMLPVVLLLFSFVHYEIAFWSSAALLYFPVTFFAFAALALTVGKPGLFRTAGSLGSGIWAVCSQANGLMVLPTVACSFFARRKTRLALLFSLIAAASFLLYFYAYKRPGVIPRFPEPTQAVTLILSAWIRLLGASFDKQWDIAASLIGLGWAGLLWKRYWRVNPTLFWFGIWLFLTMGSIAVGRASFGVESVMVSRYRFYSLLLISISYLALLELIGERSIRRYIIAVALFLAFYLYAEESPKHLSLAANERVDVIHGANYYRIEGLGPFSYGGFPEATMANGLIREMEGKGLYHMPDFSEHMSMKTPSGPDWKTSGRTLNATLLALHGAGKTLSIKGYADLDGGRCDNIKTLVFLANDADRHYYTTEALSRAKWRESVFKPCLEFAAFIDVRSLSAGEYRIGVARVHKDGSLTEYIAPPPIRFVKTIGQT